jgi:hypothetical protein
MSEDCFLEYSTGVGNKFGERPISRLVQVSDGKEGHVVRVHQERTDAAGRKYWDQIACTTPQDLIGSVLGVVVKMLVEERELNNEVTAVT